MRHLCGRGPALALAISQLARRPLRLAAAVSLAGLLVAILAIPAGAWLRGSVPGAPASPRAQATVLMPVGAGSPESAHVRDVLERADALESLRFLPRDLALAELAGRPALAGVNVAGLQPNPLPDAWVATFLPSAPAELIEATVAQWSKDPWVGAVEYDPAPWRRWMAISALARALAVPAAAALLLAGLSAFLACAALGPRPPPGESRLLLELGATPRSLRRPFVYAGAIGGLLAGLASWAISTLAWRTLGPAVSQFVGQFGLASPWLEASPWMGPGCALVCAAIAAMLAALAARLSGDWR